MLILLILILSTSYLYILLFFIKVILSFLHKLESKNEIKINQLLYLIHNILIMHHISYIFYLYQVHFLFHLQCLVKFNNNFIISQINKFLKYKDFYWKLTYFIIIYCKLLQHVLKYLNKVIFQYYIQFHNII